MNFKNALDHVMRKLGIYAVRLEIQDLFEPFTPGHYRHLHFITAIYSKLLDIEKIAKARIYYRLKKGEKLTPKELRERDLKLELRVTEGFSIGKFILMSPEYFNECEKRHDREFGKDFMDKVRLTFYRASYSTHRKL